jgi:hypothetical protein
MPTIARLGAPILLASGTGQGFIATTNFSLLEKVLGTTTLEH